MLCNILGEKELLESKNWKETGTFIYAVDEWFDVFDSFVYGDKKACSALELDKDNQVRILHNMASMMTSMRVNNSGSKSLYQFQIGVILSCYSLMGLFEMLQDSHKLDFIMARRLNQDCLEHFFGCIRQMRGAQDHTNAMSFKHRMKVFDGTRGFTCHDETNISLVDADDR